MTISKSQKLRNLLRGIDKFGRPISLLYDKKQTFTSVWGGIVTILVNLCILAFFLSLVSSIFNRTSFTITKMTTSIDLITAGT